MLELIQNLSLFIRKAFQSSTGISVELLVIINAKMLQLYRNKSSLKIRYNLSIRELLDPKTLPDDDYLGISEYNIVLIT